MIAFPALALSMETIMPWSSTKDVCVRPLAGWNTCCKEGFFNSFDE